MLYHISGKEPHGTGDGSAVSGRPTPHDYGWLRDSLMQQNYRRVYEHQLRLSQANPPLANNFLSLLAQQPLANFQARSGFDATWQLYQQQFYPQNPYQAMLASMRPGAPLFS